MRNILNIFIAILLLYSCRTEKINQEEKLINDILISVINDNPDIFNSRCNLIDKFVNGLFSISDKKEIDTGYVESISDFFEVSEMDNLIEQAHNAESYGFVTKDFKRKYRFVKKTEIDSFIYKANKSLNTDAPIDFPVEFSEVFGCVQGFSRPLISTDRKTVVIRYFIKLDSYTAGGFTKVFELVDNKWILIKELEYSIS